MITGMEVDCSCAREHFVSCRARERETFREKIIPGCEHELQMFCGGGGSGQQCMTTVRDRAFKPKVRVLHHHLSASGEQAGWLD